MNRFPPVFIIIVVVGLFFKVFMNRSIKKYNPNEEFLELERKADLTPKKNIDDLPYIDVSSKELPLDIPTDNEETKEHQYNIRTLEGKKILNFTGISNTELKLAYGAANIHFLQSCDLNFTRLAQNISRLAEDYLNEGHEQEARQLLEFGIRIGTDVKKNYTLLADIYQKSGESEKISGLKDTARDINSLSKDGILKALDGYSPS
ncbi:MAG: hypothetical protein J5829_03530 [Lachnospiraceae bacterium]|nr:hypothetical protein [Lachnospiraceae bacterium]